MEQPIKDAIKPRKPRKAHGKATGLFSTLPVPVIRRDADMGSARAAAPGSDLASKRTYTKENKIRGHQEQNSVSPARWSQVSTLLWYIRNPKPGFEAGISRSTSVCCSIVFPLSCGEDDPGKKT